MNTDTNRPTREDLESKGWWFPDRDQLTTPAAAKQVIVEHTREDRETRFVPVLDLAGVLPLGYLGVRKR